MPVRERRCWCIGLITIGKTMKTTCTRKYLAQAVACVLTLGFAAGAAAQAQQAQPRVAPSPDRQLWMDNARSNVWKNAYGECWQSASGPAPGYGECNPAPIAQYVAAPVAQAPAPAVAPAPLAQAPAPLAAPAPAAEPAALPPKRDRN
jgi:hypothetical protein